MSLLKSVFTLTHNDAKFLHTIIENFSSFNHFNEGQFSKVMMYNIFLYNYFMHQGFFREYIFKR